MAKLYRDDDIDMTVLKARRIGIVGYGNQGRAQALNLRDSGFEPMIGNREDEYKQRAIKDGFAVHPIGRVAEETDVLLLLIPDEVQAEVYDEQIRPYLEPGDVLSFASGYNIYYKAVQPPAGVPAIMVAPRMIGEAVRNLYRTQAGFPCLVAVENDADGQALSIALALAKAIGAFASSFREETLIDLFAEQMLWPGIIKLCLLYFEKLVENGCDPEIVTTELHLSGEFVEIAKAMITHGFFGQLKLHSQTSQYGQLSRADLMAPPELLARIDAVIDEISSGKFHEEWARELKSGKPNLGRLWRKVLEHPLAKSEAELEALRRMVAGTISRERTNHDQ
jgi:ketol-acid reductoisomerase